MRLIRTSGSGGMSFADLLVVTLLLPMLFVGVACLRTSTHHGGNRVKCALNLRQIGQAILLYANENGGKYPRTIWSPEAAATPVWGSGVNATNPFLAGGPTPNDVSSALFLLLRTQDVTSEVFICPSTDGEKDLFGGLNATLRSNFTDLRKNLSFSYANPYPTQEVADAGYELNANLHPDFAVAAEINPAIAGGKNVLSVMETSPFEDMRHANSTNHDGEGQNVLFGDGRVEFLTTPFCGVRSDNIYASRHGRVAAPPADKDDSVLLPTVQN